MVQRPPSKTRTISSLPVPSSNVCPGSNTGYAGKFVTITATRQYTPIFSGYGIVQNDTITTSAAVQVQ